MQGSVSTSSGCFQRAGKGRFPSDRHGPLQYGHGLKAFVVNLLVCQMVALNRVRKLIKSMIGFVLRLYQALESWALQATEPLLKAPSIKVDETSFRVDKKNHWIHVYSSADLTRKFLHRKRGTEAIEAINIIPRYGGAIIHDGWSSYWSYHHGGQLTKR